MSVDVIADVQRRIRAYAAETHPRHHPRTPCPRCDITAVLEYVAAHVVGDDR